MKTAPTTEFLTSKELADRVRVKENTVRGWRVAGTGPQYIKMAKILYPMDEVLKWEAAAGLRSSTAANPKRGSATQVRHSPGKRR